MSHPALMHDGFGRRHDAIRSELKRLNLDVAVIFNPVRVTYLTGFAHLPTERPIALLLPVDHEPIMLLPVLEEEHFTSQAPWLKGVHVYAEYPGRVHPMRQLAGLVAGLPRGKGGLRLGADGDGYIDLNGYRGPRLSEAVGAEVTPLGPAIDRLRMVKSPAELAIMRVAGRAAARTHAYLQEEIAAGRQERTIARRAEDRLAEALEGEIWSQPGAAGSVDVPTTLLSGSRTAMPHAWMGTRCVAPGDILITCCEGIAAGYHTELERTMFVGRPPERQRGLFEIAREAQQLVIERLRPGVACAEIDSEIARWFASRACERFALHHQGHGLGLEVHESPFFDIGDETILQAGMVMSVEPGLYVPGLGGFRHSDTVAITETGVEILTEYPSALEDLLV